MGGYYDKHMRGQGDLVISNRRGLLVEICHSVKEIFDDALVDGYNLHTIMRAASWSMMFFFSVFGTHHVWALDEMIYDSRRIYI